MEFEFLEDSDLYNVVIMDQKIVKVEEDPLTKELVQKSVTEMKPGDAMVYDFDVDRVGTYLGIQDTD